MATPNALPLVPIGAVPSARLALRNTAVVAAALMLNKLVRNLRRGKKRQRQRSASEDEPAEKPLGEWEELGRTSLAAGLCTTTYAITHRMTKNAIVSAIASLAPLRYLLSDRRLHANYQFVVAYLAAQVIVEAVPMLRDSPMLTMTLSTGQLLSHWLVGSDTSLPIDYIRFLHSQGKASRDVILAFRRIKEERRPMREFAEMCFPDGEWMRDPCKVDPDASLFEKWPVWFAQHMKGSMRFYAKIYTMRMIVGLATGRPIGKQLQRFVVDALRSSLFLSLYCSGAWASLTAVGTYFPNLPCTHPVLWGSVAPVAAALMLESDAQKVTIARYCASFGLYPILDATLPNSLGFDVAGIGAVSMCAAARTPVPALLRALWPVSESRPPVLHALQLGDRAAAALATSLPATPTAGLMRAPSGSLG